MAKRKGRSPKYPIFGLKTAIEKLGAFYDMEGKATVPRDIALKAWGYTAISGPALQTISTLIQYGLLDRIGGKNVKISELGLSIVWPKNTFEKDEATQKAAKNPPIFNELLERFTDDIPSDDTLKAYLLRREPTSFNENAANIAIKSFKETLEFTSLIPEEEGEKEDIAIRELPKSPFLAPKSDFVLSFALLSGKNATLAISGGAPSRADIDFIKALLGIYEDKLPPEETTPRKEETEEQLPAEKE